LPGCATVEPVFAEVPPMASLSIRNLDDETYDRLRDRATRKGVSMEEEVRQILKRAVSPPERLGDLFLKVFGPARGVDLELPAREHVLLAVIGDLFVCFPAVEIDAEARIVLPESLHPHLPGHFRFVSDGGVGVGQGDVGGEVVEVLAAPIQRIKDVVDR